MKKNSAFLRILSLMLLAFAMLLISGCRTVPVRNIENAPIVTTSQANPNMQKIGDAIIKAGTNLGWKMSQKEAGQIIGKLYVRTHRAEVKIIYNHKNYNILYDNSSNLKYNPEKSTIHRQYNNWVKNLDVAIQREIVSIQ
ncbi:MAG: hypothetical protein EOM37_10170 [Proteobacteria bacterium]|nr:hypothetical protein [Pseudomonadota bacterium]